MKSPRPKMAITPARIADIARSIQKELQCGICYSVADPPLVTNCSHLFCKECFDQWMKNERREKKTPQCPLCKKKLNHRNCLISEFHAVFVKQYLQLAKHITAELAEFALPPEQKFLESQIVRDSVVAASQICEFAVPSAPSIFAAKRKRCALYDASNASKDSPFAKRLKTVIEEDETESDVMPKTKKGTVNFSKNVRVHHLSPKKSPAKEKPQHFENAVQTEKEPTADAEAQTSIISSSSTHVQTEIDVGGDKLSLEQVKSIDFESFVTPNSANNSFEQLFELLPNLARFFEQHRSEVFHFLTMPTGEDARAYFANIEETKQNEKTPEKTAAQNEIDELEDSFETSDANNAQPKPQPQPDVLEDSFDNVFSLSTTPQKKRSPSPLNKNFSLLANLRDPNTKDSTDEATTLDFFVKKRLAFCGHSNKAQQAIVEEFCKLFASDILPTSDILHDAEAVVVMNDVEGKLPQPFGMMEHACAVVSLVPMLKSSWVVNCIQQKKILNMDKYKILMENGKSTSQSNSSFVFIGHKFALPPEFASTQHVTYDTLKSLITKSGGQVIGMDSLKRLKDPSVPIIFGVHSEQFDEANELEKAYLCSVLNGQYIIDCITQNKLLIADFEKYKLTSSRAAD